MLKQEEKSQITLDNSESTSATFPVIVSASRRTDIPAFYSDWFFYRLKKGYSAWINPFNGKKSYISYEYTKFIVFWSKNPRPLLEHIDYLRKRRIGCYIQFSLNDYEENSLERGLPTLKHRIETFQLLVDRLGKGSVVWRFDPLILTQAITIDTLLSRIRNIANQINTYTERLVFSFVDIFSHPRVKANLDRNQIPYSDWNSEQMREFSAKLVELNKSEGWNLELATCGEMADFPGIEHNRCVDDRLILRLSKSQEVWKFLNAEPCTGNCLPGVLPPNVIASGDGRYAKITKNNRDNGQRKECRCVKSKDIGQYNTCPHLCEYCYANGSKESAKRNHERHKANPYGETIIGT